MMGLHTVRCTYATGLTAVLLVIGGCQSDRTPAGKPQARAVSFPYLAAREIEAFPNYRQVAVQTSNSYVKLTLLAPGNLGAGVSGGDLHTGSGIVIDRRGHILTAAHIARGAKYRLRVELGDGRRVLARVIRISPRRELALLHAPGLAGVAPVSFAPDNSLKKGDAVLAVGSPRRVWGIVTLGIVRLPNIGERLDYGPWGFSNAIEMAMLVQSGHSGGPVVDPQGRLVGMVASYELGDTTKWPYRPPRITYAVPVADIRRWLKR
jgi:S1-C subfamily serine protease